jgi:hypothetical protein
MESTTTPAAIVAERSVADLLRETNPEAYASDVEHASAPTELSAYDPLAAARASQDLLGSIQRLVRENALKARGRGENWWRIASALSLLPEGRPDSAAAYRTVLGAHPDERWWTADWSVIWTCSTCGEAVRELGPDFGGPDERESGHAATCSRHAADVRAWEALWA